MLQTRRDIPARVLLTAAVDLRVFSSRAITEVTCWLSDTSRTQHTGQIHLQRLALTVAQLFTTNLQGVIVIMDSG